MTPDEKHLVRRFQAGETDSFKMLYVEYGARIYRFCRRLCGNEADAEDLTQEVFLAAFKGLDRFEGRSSLATWLYRIAFNRWSRIRSNRRLETVPLDDEQPILSSDPSKVGLDRIFLERALNALPVNYREAFLLVKGEGLLCREAAEVLGIPEGTLKSRVYGAVVRLQRLMESEESAVPVKHGGNIRKKEVCDEV